MTQQRKKYQMKSVKLVTIESNNLNNLCGVARRRGVAAGVAAAASWLPWRRAASAAAKWQPVVSASESYNSICICAQLSRNRWRLNKCSLYTESVIGSYQRNES